MSSFEDVVGGLEQLKTTLAVLQTQTLEGCELESRLSAECMKLLMAHKMVLNETGVTLSELEQRMEPSMPLSDITEASYLLQTVFAKFQIIDQEQRNIRGSLGEATTNSEFRLTEAEQSSQNDVEYAPMLCCACGVSMKPNPTRMCANCVKTQYDITEGISRQVLQPFCKQCERYLRPPWMKCELESPELLALCLKKLKGLNRVKLVKANFLYTEPHSKRLRVRILIEKEVVHGAVLQQWMTVEFIVQALQCDACKRTFTPHSWNASVQIRQRASHKRTILFLEQLILKHDAHEKVINIEDKPDGMDFHFSNRREAIRFVDFVQSHFPIRKDMSVELISHDTKSNTAFQKFSYAVEICPICRDDLVFLGHDVAKMFGGVSPFMICHKISTAIHLIDPFSLRGVDVASEKFWRNPFQSLYTRKQLTEFMVFSVEEIPLAEIITAATARRFLYAKAVNLESASVVSSRFGPDALVTGRMKLIEVEVARLTDLGQNDDRIIVRSHLGAILRAGDIVLGYDMRTLNSARFDDPVAKAASKLLYDVVLVRKGVLPKTSVGIIGTAAERRAWILQTLPRNLPEKKTRQQAMEVADMEDFKQEIEENLDMRAHVELYKDPGLVEVDISMLQEKEKHRSEMAGTTPIDLTSLMEGLTIA